MSFVITASIIVIMLTFLYRFVPAAHMKKMDVSHVKMEDDMVTVDTRDYQTSSQDRFEQAYCLPLAYLERHHHDLPKRAVVLVSSDEVEKNMAARLLRRKGFQVTGYCLPSEEEECRAMPCMMDK